MSVLYSFMLPYLPSFTYNHSYFNDSCLVILKMIEAFYSSVMGVSKSSRGGGSSEEEAGNTKKKKKKGKKVEQEIEEEEEGEDDGEGEDKEQGLCPQHHFPV